ncbi:DUF411 domain-containing protein [Zhongshania sp. BJYM1]|uniref:DUF411 domain-containing protein n=1 Tax=Zhongshania aquatica TaxID=2965069 RepID=UPI0022B346A0|nr:DUF411 domain-containing protein [Marortus sp. BJYM1]
MIKFRYFLLLCVLLKAGIVFAESIPAAVSALDVFKSPSCGCCGKWVDHLEEHGFTTKVYHPGDLDQKKVALGVPRNLSSCHTGVSENGYFFEGHVPASVVASFLANPPADAAGLAVPGMPVGSPGMEMGGRFTPYSVILVKNDGTTEVFARMESYNDQF